MLLGIYDYTVIMTYLGLLIGYTGITFAMQGNVHTALFCLMGAGFCDMFDGAIASTKPNRTSKERRFGIQIDSLSDLVCFGVLPGLIIYKNCYESRLAFAASALYVLAALIRLAYFNVDEEERQSKTDASRSYYLGLPVTTSALLLPLVLGIADLKNLNTALLGPMLLIMIGTAFLLPFKLKKPDLRGKIGVLLCGSAELIVLIVGVFIS